MPTTATTTWQCRARPSKIPIRTLSQATSASQDFGLEVIARPNRHRSASRSFERSLGQLWSLSPSHSWFLHVASPLKDEIEEGGSGGLGNEDMAEKADDEKDSNVSR